MISRKDRWDNGTYKRRPLIFPYNRRDRPDRFKKFRDDPDDWEPCYLLFLSILRRREARKFHENILSRRELDVTDFL